MRRLFPLIAVALVVAAASHAAEPDTAFLLEFLAGDYRLVGQLPDSGAAYVGRVTLTEHNGQFDVVRNIAGVSTQSTGRIEIVGEGTKVLRCKFAVGGTAYEATYLWKSDLDNYPRLTGHVYRAEGETKSPGLEALFHVPPTPEK